MYATYAIDEDSHRTMAGLPSGPVRVTAILMDPFTRGERSETLFFIPPAVKGAVDEGTARGRPIKIEISIGSPRGKGYIETAMREVPS
jgi:hypothetical protein